MSADAQSKNWDLLALLPETLPAADIVAANRDLGADIHRSRQYLWGRWRFEVPPGVFLPGVTSQLTYDRLLNGSIPVAGLRYAAMGCGLGVEAVIAGFRKASMIYGIDVHEVSVHTAERHYHKYNRQPGAPFIGVVSNLWEDFPQNTQVDVVTCNPPFVGVRLSDDPDIIRTLCVGQIFVEKFFSQLAGRSILAPTGTVYLTLSNTAPLREIVSAVLTMNFEVEVIHAQKWPGGNVRTFIFAIRYPL
jgi:release factor glutamine methyltransferase